MRLTIILLILCLTFNLYAQERFRVDKDIPYRLWVGSEKYDWIDFIGIYNSNFEPIFKDKSPIVKIYDYPEYEHLIIFKEKSVWRYWYGDVWGIVKLLEPPYKDLEVEKRLIFER